MKTARGMHSISAQVLGINSCTPSPAIEPPASLIVVLLTLPFSITPP